MIPVAINGFGRIGKSFLRVIMTDPKAQKNISVVAINIGPGNTDLVGHLFKYDTLMGIFPGTVEQRGDKLIVNDHTIKLLAFADPAQCNWKKLGIEWVVDCSGKFTHRADAEKHIKGGARKVLISAPATDEDVAIIPGVNDDMYNPKKHTIVSLGSCTTNAVFPMLKILHESCGLQTAMMLTTHAYTNSQVLLDIEARDARLSRAAALNIIPTSTGASKMIAKIIPALKGKVEMSSVRVPVGKVSLIEITAVLSKQMSVQQINKHFAQAARGKLKNIVQFTTEQLVSSDFSNNPHSVIIDSLLTKSVGELISVFGWYDNEWGYSARLKDFLLEVR